jgi:hypothetical protein
MDTDVDEPLLIDDAWYGRASGPAFLNRVGWRQTNHLWKSGLVQFVLRHKL